MYGTVSHYLLQVAVSGVTFKRRGEDVTAAEVNTVLLQMESAEKWFSATYINGYQKHKYPLHCKLNKDFFTAIVCRQTVIYSCSGLATV